MFILQAKYCKYRSQKYSCHGLESIMCSPLKLLLLKIRHNILTSHQENWMIFNHRSIGQINYKI